MSYPKAHSGLAKVSQPEFSQRARAALKAFMLSERLTDKHIASAVGVHPNTVKGWRNGSDMPAYAIAQLGVLFGPAYWQSVFGEFGLAMRRRYEQRVAAERQALHEWSFMVSDTGT